MVLDVVLPALVAALVLGIGEPPERGLLDGTTSGDRQGTRWYALLDALVNFRRRPGARGARARSAGRCGPFVVQWRSSATA